MVARNLAASHLRLCKRQLNATRRCLRAPCGRGRCRGGPGGSPRMSSPTRTARASQLRWCEGVRRCVATKRPTSNGPVDLALPNGPNLKNLVCPLFCIGQARHCTATPLAVATALNTCHAGLAARCHASTARWASGWPRCCCASKHIGAGSPPGATVAPLIATSSSCATLFCVEAAADESEEALPSPSCIPAALEPPAAAAAAAPTARASEEAGGSPAFMVGTPAASASSSSPPSRARRSCPPVFNPSTSPRCCWRRLYGIIFKAWA